MKKKTLYTTIIFLAIIIGGVGYLVLKKPGRLDAFAQCLEQKGAIFYGTFWCSHCQNQKALFGASKQYLPYIECSTPDGRGQTLACQQKKIDSYPTWEFADGTRRTGEMTLTELAEKTGCELPPET